MVQKTYCDDRGKDTKILQHQALPKSGIVETVVAKGSKGITTESLGSGFMKGNVDETIMDMLINTKTGMSNIIAANISQALHKANYSSVKQLPNTIEELVKIKGIGKKSAELIIKLKKEKR